MIESIELIRNISQFEKFSNGENLKLSKLTLIYGENGRGKTTLSAILRSFGSGSPIPILERRRLTTDDEPHVVIKTTEGNSIFKNKNWMNNQKHVVVFDDHFVNENIYSGLSIDSSHKKNLHELIIGPQGVKLNKELIETVESIEVINKTLKLKERSIPVDLREHLEIDDFCKLTKHKNVDTAICETEKEFKAAKQQDEIRNAKFFNKINIEKISIEKLQELLFKGMSNLEAESVDKLNKHFETLGDNAESWISKGVSLIDKEECPYCSQSTKGIELVSIYKEYFSEDYKNLKSSVLSEMISLDKFHSGEVRAAFERSVRAFSESYTFWSNFLALDEIEVNTTEISKIWRSAYEIVKSLLEKKKDAPLEVMNVDNSVITTIDLFNNKVDLIFELNSKIDEINEKVETVKEKVEAGNIGALSADLARLKATKNRFKNEIDIACKNYLEEKAKKEKAEEKKKDLREKLDKHQKETFPKFKNTINDYLRRFSANFRLGEMDVSNTRAGTSCIYDILIYEKSVNVTGKVVEGKQSFQNTLSSGDRSTLALAFFFASIDENINMSEMIVVIDDPMTSLDNHRIITTVQEIRKLSPKVAQVIVLSHKKPFLCRIWEHADISNTSSITVARGSNASILKNWNVSEDSLTEYDRKHALLRSYLGGHENEREVAQALRPVLEGYLRVARSESFPPGSLLGPFISKCKQRLQSEEMILSANTIEELDSLKEYANKFHHDTNPAWETETINDGELLSFVERVLVFTKFS